MAVTTVDQYGAPSYGDLGRPVAGVIFHTPENVDPTLAQAIAVAQWQGTPANTSGGSYHGILGHDSVKFTHSWATCTNPVHWRMVRSVPWNKAAGGVTSNHTPPSQGGVWAPDRFPWIKQLVHAGAYADPNKYFHQIAIGGKAAQYVQNGYPLGLLMAVAEWVKILEDAYGYSSVMTLHRQWQTNRSDPGPENFADLVLVEYNKMFSAPTPTPEPTPTPTPPPLPAPTTYTQAEVDALLYAERSKVAGQITAAVDTAVAPYKQRIAEFRELAGRAL